MVVELTKALKSRHAVTESIYSGKNIVIPLADVQHIEKTNPLGLIVVTKHTRWDREIDGWANNAWVDAAEAPAFMRAWCRYRSELEADTLADLEPANEYVRDNGQFGVGA
jgi:hypothetical protein